MADEDVKFPNELKVWHLILTAAIGISGGGGAGTWMASAQVEDRLRDAEQNQTKLQADIENIKDDVKESKEEIKANTVRIQEIDRNVDRALILLEQVKEKVDEE